MIRSMMFPTFTVMLDDKQSEEAKGCRTGNEEYTVKQVQEALMDTPSLRFPLLQRESPLERNIYDRR